MSKQYKIGETVKHDGEIHKCVKDETVYDSCDECSLGNGCSIIKECYSGDRKDGNSVHFELVGDNPLDNTNNKAIQLLKVLKTLDYEIPSYLKQGIEELLGEDE